jgi:hypothetical protein
MSYEVAEVGAASGMVEKLIAYDDIPISAGGEFTGSVGNIAEGSGESEIGKVYPLTGPDGAVEPTRAAETAISDAQKIEMIKEAILSAKPGAVFSLTAEGGFLAGVPEGVPAGALAGLPFVAAVNGPDGRPSGQSAVVGTGTTIQFADKPLTAVVYGDVNGTGAVELADVNAVLSHFRGRMPLEGAYLKAADINSDGNITLAVVNRILSYFRGRIGTLKD